MKALWAVGAVAIATWVGGCGDSIKSQDIPSLEASYDNQAIAHQGTWTVGSGDVQPGQAGWVSEMRIINTGTGVLDIESITIASTPPGAFKLVGSPSLEALDPGPYEIIAQNSGDEGEQRLVFGLALDRGLAGDAPTAVVSIASNSVVNGQKIEVTTFNVVLEGGQPRIQVNPLAVDFPQVRPDQGPVPKTLQILNPGNEPLLIEGFTLKGHQNFSVVFPGMEPYESSAETVQGITFPEPLEIAPQGQISASVVFFATGPDPATGELLLLSNDPTAVNGTLVPLQANVGGPCIAVSPTKVDFGGKLVGRTVTIDVDVTSCGDKPLEIQQLVLAPDGSDEFSLILDGVEGIDGENVGGLETTDPHVVLEPNEKATFKVQYIANDVSELDGTGLPIRDTTKIQIKTNSFIPDIAVDVSGFGVLVECPTAVIVVEGVEDGGEVTPQTKLNLIGHESYAATGGISEYQWRVNAPIGSVSTFTPSATSADPKFEVNVAGTYEFELTVKDDNGVNSCAPARTTIFVVPSQAIHIELLWHTPNDTDETNEGAVAGSDLDLHFAHPFAGESDFDGDGQPDPWFASQWDCFWNNEHPNWANFSPAVDDDPDLDRDDTDGGGPENINLNQPENNTCYNVGVHYWEDNEFGAAYATVRVYLYANLVFEVEGVEMLQADMWSVTKVCWPAGSDAPKATRICRGTFDPCATAEDCGGSSCDLRIAHDYTPANIPH